MTTNHRPEHGTGPSDAQLLDYLRRGAVHTPDGTVIGWVPPTPAVGTGSLTYNDVDGLACRECGTDLLRPGEGDALPWREIRDIIDSHTASQHQAHSGIHPLPEYEPPAHPHTSTPPISTHEPDPTRAELIAFLRARLDEDEQTALPFCDPARVLADIDARRRVVDMFEQYEHATTRIGDTATPGLPSWLDGGQAALDRALRLLALPYADHPDYRAEWRP
jgi:hypothetical protein